MNLKNIISKMSNVRGNVSRVSVMSGTEDDSDEDMQSESESIGNEGNVSLKPLLQPTTQFKDRWRMGFIIFTLFGIGGTIPWNFFINANQYWEYKFRDVNQTEPVSDPTKRTVLQAKFESYLSIASMVPGIFGFLLCTLYSSRFSLHSRVTIPLSVVGLLFIPTVVFAKINTDTWQLMFFVTTLITVAFMNCLSAYFQASTFGIAGMMHHRFIKAMMNGQAIGGILASVARIFTLFADTSETTSAVYYFCAAFGFVMACLIAYGVLLRTAVYGFYLSTIEGYKLRSINSDSVETLQSRVKLVFLKIKLHAASVMVVFIITLSIFPALATLVVSVDRNNQSPWTGKYFLPVVCFLLYNCGDFCGRCIANWIPVIPRKSVWLFIICSLRIVYIPLFLLCNAHPRTNLPVVFNSDVTYIILTSTFALSNGYLATLCIMNAPKEVEPEHQELAGILMALIMAIGIAIGALLSNIVIAIL